MDLLDWEKCLLSYGRWGKVSILAVGFECNSPVMPPNYISDLLADILQVPNSPAGIAAAQGRQAPSGSGVGSKVNTALFLEFTHHKKS